MDLTMYKRSILYAKVLLCVKYIPIRCFKVKRSLYEVHGLILTSPKSEKRDLGLFSQSLMYLQPLNKS